MMMTPRHTEILLLLASGLSINEIAERLSLRPGTVKSHLCRIYTAMNVSNGTGAVISALKKGLIRLDQIKVKVASR